VNESELKNLERSSSLPVIVLSGTPFDSETSGVLRLQLLKSFTGRKSKEIYFAYRRMSH
jgi:hypothetical protein